MDAEKQQQLLTLITQAQALLIPPMSATEKDMSRMLTALSLMLENPGNQQLPFYFESWFIP
ncbi:hypothetical protein JAF88_002297 [Citrobacter freundii]|uniref:hypothetical protein n=1 Tax=Klebsiella TaxID=570 RepID=UPI000574D57B|nr:MULTISPECIES: hypothetical protein [Klebsiella]EGT0625551.1 hypothetical protein [Citrobacter freundii]KHM32380.1 hypothetical protein KV34_13420 [Klebsiella aerogenes]